MKIVFFVHSLMSCWNHGNAHFLRGVVRELQERGHDVDVYEPAGGWSMTNLVEHQGHVAVDRFRERFPHLSSTAYDPATIDLDRVLDDADLVVVHEWNEPELVERIGRACAASDALVLFHDTHHRAVTDPHQMARFDLSNYDGVLAFGSVIRDVYLDRGWTQRAWTWHEAADTRIFRPRDEHPEADLVWIGNWGDGERTAELDEYLLGPARALDLTGTIHGVRYPPAARRAIASSGLTFRGWIANHDVPAVFARHSVTIHVPRRPYARRMTGVPTIRVFEALACGVPLVTAPWEDSEHLFRPGTDYLMAGSGSEMETHLKEVLNDAHLAAELASNGLETIAARHTCAHRVDELLSICEELS
ncbi:MAG TPA: glycosyltransferase [Actinomycetota bacterium]|nr:glycosyltransferase [Actinomycetota bacterium]